MVTKSKKPNPGKKKKVKVLKLDKETIKDLTKDRAREIRGGLIVKGTVAATVACVKGTVVACCLDTATATITKRDC